MRPLQNYLKCGKQEYKNVTYVSQFMNLKGMFLNTSKPNIFMVNENLKKIVKGAALVFIGIIISKIFTYFYRLYIARYLGAENYGLLNLGFAVLGVATAISLLGLPSGVLRYVSYYKGKENYKKVTSTIISSLKITIPLSIIIGILLFIFSKNISIHLFHTEKLIIIIKLFAILVPFSVILSNLEVITQAFQKIKYNIFIRNISESSIQLFSTILLVSIGLGILGAVIGYMIAIFSSALLFFLVVQKKVYPFINAKIKIENNYKEILFYSWPLIFVYLLGMIIAWTDNIFIGYFKDASSVGLYNTALPTSRLLMIIPTTIIFLFIPIITELYGKNKKKEVEKVYKTTTKWTFFLNFPIMLLMILFSKQILNFLFGKEYLGAASALVVLSLGHFFYSLTQLSSSVLQSIKKTKIILLNSIIIIILNLILNIYLISKYGILGAAIATSISFFVSSILFYFEAYIFTKIQPITSNMLKSMIAGVLSTAIIYLIIKFIFVDLSLLLAIPLAIIFFVLYIILLLIFKSFDKEDLLIIRSILNKFNIKLFKKS